MPAPLPLSTQPVRVLVVWCPNWSVEAVNRSLGTQAPDTLALIRSGRVVAVSHHAQNEAVTIGLRVREAQVRCPNLTLVPHDDALDERHFAPVLRAVEKVVPHVHVVRPGLVAVRMAGAARFYGSQDAVVEAVLDQLAELDLPDVRVAVADGLFAAEHAAYATSAQRPIIVLPTETTDRFLRTLPVETVAAAVDQPDLAQLLRRMGIRNLSALAKLPREHVHARFGTAGLRAHQLASGQDAPLLRSAAAPADLTTRATYDPPLADVTGITQGARQACADLTQRLQRTSQVCHEVLIEVVTQQGLVHGRRWRHTWPLRTDDMVERLRWQLEDLTDETGEADAPFDAVCSVTVSAESTTPASAHAQGLWGERPSDHLTHTITTLQRDLGHGGVCGATLVGGRLLHERQQLHPWGDAPPQHVRRDQPWPGTLPGPAPATVFERARPAQVRSAGWHEVLIDARGNLSAEPSHWRPAHDPPDDQSAWRRIVAWNGPWPIRQHWWQRSLQVNRFQVIDEAAQAWLLIATSDSWWIEARYD